jgi:hypothetical protein
MAILNLSTKIYNMIKKESEISGRKIAEQAVYYFLWGYLMDKNEKFDCRAAKRFASDNAKTFKITD